MRSIYRDELRDDSNDEEEIHIENQAKSFVHMRSRALRYGHEYMHVPFYK